MPSAHPTIARIRLSRSLPRLLALPTLGLLAGLATVAGGLLLVPGALGLVVAGAGAALAALAIVGFALPLSVRLEIEESAVRVSWLGGERIYVLSPGPVTRVRLRGENASSLRGGRRLLGGQLGSARLRGEEQIDVVRLAPTATAILIPTDRGRLAIAASSEELLLDALSHAARARQRLQELEREVPPAEEPPAPVEIEVDPALMTGIERALHERQMAEEREAADAAALAQLAAAEAAATAEAEVAEAAATEVQASTAAKPRRRLGLALRRPRPSTALVLLPLAGAGAAWGIGLMLDRMPDPGSEVGRLTALALVLAGPAATVGAIMARVWWPRLVGVVVAGGLAAAVFVGRSLIGA